MRRSVGQFVKLIQILDLGGNGWMLSLEFGPQLVPCFIPINNWSIIFLSRIVGVLPTYLILCVRGLVIVFEME